MATERSATTRLKDAHATATAEVLGLPGQGSGSFSNGPGVLAAPEVKAHPHVGPTPFLQPSGSLCPQWTVHVFWPTQAAATSAVMSLPQLPFLNGPPPAPELGGSACCYWNGLRQQCNHPAQDSPQAAGSPGLAPPPIGAPYSAKVTDVMFLPA